jgi:DNA-binding NarL/FixJ family response regulator
VIHGVVVRIAVVDPLPMFRDGVVAALAESGHLVEAPADVLAWVQRRTTNVVLLTTVSERHWELLDQLCDATVPSLVVALLDGDSTSLGVRAVRAGARSVLERGASAAVLRRTVEATVDGQAVLPAVLAAELATDSQARHGPTADQLSWLRQLAAGVTVVQLANSAGYSERAMYRLLQALYRQLGVRSRTQAIMHAQDAGWLGRG